MFVADDAARRGGMNQFFEKNLPRNVEQLRGHLDAADLVPLDFRNLTPRNQSMFMKEIYKLPLADQQRVLIVK